MQRVGRLWSPAFAFSVIGLAGVVTAPLPGFQLRGGIRTSGLYVLALQLVVSALAVSVINDIWDPRLTELRPERPWQAKGRIRDEGPVRFRRALWHFYLWHPLPAALLACGLSISLSLVAIGSLDHNIGVVVREVFGSTR